MTRKTGWALLLAGMAGLLGLCGCESSGGGGSGSANTPVNAGDSSGLNANVTGTWTGSRTSGGASSAATLVLTQNGSSVGGSYADNSSFTGPVSGSINGDNLNLTVTMATAPVPFFPGEEWTIQGAVNAAGNKIVATMRGPNGDTFTLKVNK